MTFISPLLSPSHRSHFLRRVAFYLIVFALVAAAFVTAASVYSYVLRDVSAIMPLPDTEPRANVPCPLLSAEHKHRISVITYSASPSIAMLCVLAEGDSDLGKEACPSGGCC